jgi:hypothetical protein
MELPGKIIQILPEESGQSSRGEWRKQQYILETEGQYPKKKVCFMAWGDKIDEFSIKEGENITLSINIESREYNGKWYTDVKAWKVDRGDKASASASASASAPASEPDMSPTPPPMDSHPFGDDDIPF